MVNPQNFVEFGPYEFVQISPACGPDTYQVMYGEILVFRLFNLKATSFRCSKNYGSPTRVTMLKVAPNMADPISKD